MALRRSDGRIVGTDVAKETPGMVLAADNFATIYAAVKEGRVVFDNIRINPFSNRFLFGTIVGAPGVHTLAAHRPPLELVLGFQPLAPTIRLIMVGIASSVLLVVETEKAIRRVAR